MFCSNCGNNLNKENNFCTQCGQVISLSPLEKFEVIKASVLTEEKSLLDNNVSGLDNKNIAAKLLYKAMDEQMRKDFSQETNDTLDYVNERKYVLQALKDANENGYINNEELAEIVNSKEFTEYTARLAEL